MASAKKVTKLDMCTCSKLVYIDVRGNETYISGGQKLFSQESLPGMNILSPEISCCNKNLPPDKCPADRKLCRTKPNFDFFSRTNVRCSTLFHGLHGRRNIETIMPVSIVFL